MNLDFLNYLPIIIIVVVVVILAIVFLPMLRGSMRSSKLMQTGVSAPAQILKVWQTGMTINDQPQIGFLLQVQPA
ncbi:MAG TPA: hypothetical protein VFF70_03325, partial [Anaerolineae bacterium]|nr:hypothetical protein [Anaerolineae bacterium]